jgi:hypothetical protein
MQLSSGVNRIDVQRNCSKMFPNPTRDDGRGGCDSDGGEGSAIISS